MKNTRPFFHWPASFLPVCRLAGIFPMIVPECNRTYGGSKRHPSVTTALHLHDYPGHLFIDREHYRLEAGDITFSPAHLPSRYRLQESGTHLCIHFEPARAVSRPKAVRLPLHLRLGPQTAAARDRFWRVIDYTRQAGGKSNVVVAGAASAAMQELLLWLALQTTKGTAPRRSSLVEPALKKLRATVDSSIARPSSIAELATGAGLGPAYLSRAFARHYGMTVQQYLLQRRIEQARHLLTTSDLRVSDVGARVGLPDPQYFNKQFRRVAGISPLAYRRENARGSWG